MNVITLEFDAIPRTGFKEYMESLKGVKDVEIMNNETCFITLKYDPELIDINMIKLEIVTFLDIYNIPSLMSFDKHEEEKVKEYNILIKDTCCEYCFSGNIEELLNISGIVKASSDFNRYDNFHTDNVSITVTYLEEIITEEQIKKIEDKFNN